MSWITLFGSSVSSDPAVVGIQGPVDEKGGDEVLEVGSIDHITWSGWHQNSDGMFLMSVAVDRQLWAQFTKNANSYITWH